MAKIFKLPYLLLILAFATDLLFPILIWKGIIPGSLRYISHAAVAAMVALVPLRMLSLNKIPPVFLLILFLSIVGVLTALFTGQGVAPTIWGWWLMFQFPLVGLFTYLQSSWPKSLPKYLVRVCIVIIAIEVVIQMGQYLVGEAPGDNIAGTFGENGTGNLVLFLILISCFSLGEWLANHRWRILLLTLVPGIAGSILGEMKLFYIVILLLSVIALAFYVLRGNQLWKLAPIILLIGVMLLTIGPIYNAVIPSAREIPLESYLTDPQLLSKYLNITNKSTTGESYYYDIGRNYAVVYGWDKINSNPLYLPFGYGLGARAESKSLGIIGRGLAEGELGVTSGTSLLVILQETGVVGMLVLAGFILAAAFSLARQIRGDLHSDANGLRYGLIIFTLLLPLWLWYNAAWTLRVPMLLYWSTLGYVTGEYARLKAAGTLHQPSLAAAFILNPQRDKGSSE